MFVRFGAKGALTYEGSPRAGDARAIALLTYPCKHLEEVRCIPLYLFDFGMICVVLSLPLVCNVWS